MSRFRRPPLPPGLVDTSRVQIAPFWWGPLPQHPKVAAQPVSGQRITAMHAHKGIMYLGYGDWSANTGPMAIVGYDIRSGQPVTLLDSVPSEAIDRFRVLDGNLYAPWVDPYGGNDGGLSTNEGGTWHNVYVGEMVHTLDVAFFAGALFVCGSIYTEGSVPGTVGDGVVYRRDPRTKQWSIVLRGATSAPFARFYQFVTEGSELVVYESERQPGVGDDRALRYATGDGLRWSESVAPLRGEYLDSTDRGRYPDVARPEMYVRPTIPERQMLGGVGGGYIWGYDPVTKRVVRAPYDEQRG